MARTLIPPEQPPTDGEIVLRLRRADDVPAIAEASHDPETMRWLDDEPLTAERQHDAVERALEQWRTGRGAPFVIADAGDDRPLGLLNVQFEDDEEVAGLAVSVFPQARGRGVASRALRLAAEWALRELDLRRAYAEAAVGTTSPPSGQSRRRASAEKAFSARTARRTGAATTAWCSRSFRPISPARCPAHGRCECG